MINSILTIVNNITTYVTNNIKVFIYAFAVAVITSIVFNAPLDSLDSDDILIILVGFIFDFIFASVILMRYLK